MNLVQIAKEYRDKYCFSVFPVVLSYNIKTQKYEKKPAVSTWLPYTNRFPTDEEIQKGFGNPKVNAIGLVTGEISSITVLDWDGKEDCPYKSSVMVKTISGGKHVYFKYEKGIKNTVKVGGKDLDVRGEHGFVVVPPSECNGNKYTWEFEGDLSSQLKLLPKFPTLKHDEIMSDHNLKAPLNVRDYTNADVGSRDDKLHRLACSLLQKHSQEEAWILLLSVARGYEDFGDSFTEDDAKAKFNSAFKFIKSEGKLFDEQNRKGNKSKQKKEKDKSVYTSFFETETYILEEIRCPVEGKNDANSANSANSSAVELTSLKFLKYSKADGALSIIDEIKEGEKVIKPITTQLALNGVVNLPIIHNLPDINQFAELAELASLICEIQEFYDQFFEVPEFERKFLPYYTLFTWVYEKFPFIPYMQFVGLTGTGKTRAGETVAGLCYKSIDVRGSASMAAIFRLADEWKGTLFVDEFDMDSFGKDNYGAALAFLKSGVGDGSVLRVEGANRKTVTAYSVKAPKVFTSEKPIMDAGLQSRTYVIEMEASKRKLPLFKIKNKYDEKINDLRTRLLYWRLKNLGNINLTEIEWGYPELEIFDQRVQQVITPVYYLADIDSRKSILKFAKEQEEATYNERRSAISGLIFETIMDTAEYDPEFSEIFAAVNKRLEREGSKQISKKAFGKIIKANLHFETIKKGHDNVTYISWTKEKFESMLKYHGFKETMEEVINILYE